LQANRFTLTKFLLQISNIDYSLLIGTLLDNIEMYLCLINLMIRMFESTILENESGKGFYSYDNLDFKKSSKYNFRKPHSLEVLKEEMDITERLFKIPDTPFLIKVRGDSMTGCGIDSGDTLLVDKSKKAKHGDIVIAAINNKLAVKRLNYSYKETMLIAENENYMPIMIHSGDKLDIWGVVTMVIKDMTKKGN